jgi:hypothetical protein
MSHPGSEYDSIRIFLQPRSSSLAFPSGDYRAPLSPASTFDLSLISPSLPEVHAKNIIAHAERGSLSNGTLFEARKQRPELGRTEVHGWRRSDCGQRKEKKSSTHRIPFSCASLRGPVYIVGHAPSFAVFIHANPAALAKVLSNRPPRRKSVGHASGFVVAPSRRINMEAAFSNHLNITQNAPLFRAEGNRSENRRAAFLNPISKKSPNMPAYDWEPESLT